MEGVLKPFPLFLKACVFLNTVTQCLGFWVRDGVLVLLALWLLTLTSSFLRLQQRCILGGTQNHSGAAVLQVIVQVLDSSPSSHHVLSDTRLYLPLSLPKATKRGVQSAHRTETLTQRSTPRRSPSRHTFPSFTQRHPRDGRRPA